MSASVFPFVGKLLKQFLPQALLSSTHLHINPPSSKSFSCLLLSSRLRIPSKPFAPMATCVDSSQAKSTLNFSPCKLRHTQMDHCIYNMKYIDLSRSGFSDPVLHPAGDCDEVWATIRCEAQSDAESEPILKKFYVDSILSHESLESALASYLANKLSSPNLMACDTLAEAFLRVLAEDPSIGRAVRADLRAAHERDPACANMVHCMLYYKGFLALQAHRVAHGLWASGRAALALYIQGRVSEAFAVDIHPGAHIGSGVLLDHATGVVIGETAVVGNDVSILHGVTLGGTGKECGDRHPKIGDGVLVGAGTHILGNVRIGAGAKVGAGSVVLKPVPPRTTAVGNPARLLGGKENPMRLKVNPGLTMDQTSWSDYVI